MDSNYFIFYFRNLGLGLSVMSLSHYYKLSHISHMSHDHMSQRNNVEASGRMMLYSM